MVGQIKHIVVIESLGENDRKTGKELYDDVIRRNIDYKQQKALKMSHKLFEAPTKQDFINILTEITQVSDSFSDGILIHLETHGASNKTGLILADGQLISWSELTDIFREINIATNNNLYVTMATCLGRYMYKAAPTTQKAPYSGYISASKEVSPNEILENFSLLFETLIESGNLIYSYQVMEKQGSNFYYKDCEATFNANFEKFRCTQEFKDKISKAAREEVARNTGTLISPEEADIIYDNALQDNYEIQSKNFLFK